MTNDLHQLMTFGPTPPWPGYFQALAEQAKQETTRLLQLRRIKAMLRLADVLQTCEHQEAA